MIVRFLGEAVDRLDPIGAARQESLCWSVECSTVVFSWISAFGQHIYSVASEGYCISGGKPFRADILDRCLIRLKQNLSFVIIPLKMGCISAAIGPFGRIIRNCVWGTPRRCLRFSTTQHLACSLARAKRICLMLSALLPITSTAL
jgi:hypothetical protein